MGKLNLLPNFQKEGGGGARQERLFKLFILHGKFVFMNISTKQSAKTIENSYFYFENRYFGYE